MFGNQLGSLNAFLGHTYVAEDHYDRVIAELLADDCPPTVLEAWSAYTGPRGGRGWKNQQSGNVAYQLESPDKVGVKQGSDTEPTQVGANKSGGFKPQGGKAPGIMPKAAPAAPKPAVNFTTGTTVATPKPMKSPTGPTSPAKPAATNQVASPQASSVDDFTARLKQEYQNIRGASHEPSPFMKPINELPSTGTEEQFAHYGGSNMRSWLRGKGFGENGGWLVSPHDKNTEWKDRLHFNVHQSPDAIKVLGEYVKARGGYFKVPETDKDWTDRSDPVVAYFPKPLGKDDFAEISKNMKPWLRGNYQENQLVGTEISPGIASVKEPTDDDVQSLLKSAGDGELGSAIKGYFKHPVSGRLSPSAANFAAAKRVVDSTVAKQTAPAGGQFIIKGGDGKSVAFNSKADLDAHVKKVEAANIAANPALAPAPQPAGRPDTEPHQKSFYDTVKGLPDAAVFGGDLDNALVGDKARKYATDYLQSKGLKTTPHNVDVMIRGVNGLMAKDNTTDPAGPQESDFPKPGRDDHVSKAVTDRMTKVAKKFGATSVSKFWGDQAKKMGPEKFQGLMDKLSKKFEAEYDGKTGVFANSIAAPQSERKTIDPNAPVEWDGKYEPPKKPSTLDSLPAIPKDTIDKILKSYTPDIPASIPQDPQPNGVPQQITMPEPPGEWTNPVPYTTKPPQPGSIKIPNPPKVPPAPSQNWTKPDTSQVFRDTTSKPIDLTKLPGNDDNLPEDGSPNEYGFYDSYRKEPSADNVAFSQTAGTTVSPPKTAAPVQTPYGESKPSPDGIELEDLNDFSRQHGGSFRGDLSTVSANNKNRKAAVDFLRKKGIKLSPQKVDRLIATANINANER